MLGSKALGFWLINSLQRWIIPLSRCPNPWKVVVISAEMGLAVGIMVIRR